MIRSHPLKRLIALISLALLAVAVPSATAAVKFFQSPSGNIGCVIATTKSEGSARCDIAKRSWKPPPAPASCKGLDYGQGLIVLNKHKGTYTCAGDTVLHTGPKKTVGTVIKLGGFRCTVRRGSVSCVRTATQHGFTISKKSASLF